MESKVKSTALDSEETKAELKNFHVLIRLRYGPFGMCALFPSPVGGGGVVSLTSRSEKLLQMLQPKGPVSGLIVSYSQAHVSSHGDSGLYTALLATKLILSGLDIDKPRYKVAMVTSYALSLVAEWLLSDNCPCKIPLSLATSQELLCLTCTHVSSKSLKLGLSAGQADHISTLIVQAFLSALPGPAVRHHSFPAHVHVGGCAGQPLEESRLLHGVAIEVNDAQLLAQLEEGGDSIKRTNEGDILTAIFNVSLAGDFEDALSSDWSILASRPLSVTVEGLVLDGLLSLAAGLVSSGVGMVGCQKCVHPLVKEYLREEGLLVVERLSAVHIDSVGEVTGGQVNSQTDHNSIHLGRLKNLSLATVGKKRYLVMEGIGHVTSPHCTLVVCTPTETMADEIIPLCRSSVSLLEQTLGSPHSLLGGGCTDTLVSHMLSEKAVGPVGGEVLEEVESDEGTYRMVLKSIAKCFSNMAAALEHNGGLVLTDSAHHHCWSFPPYDYCTSVHNRHSGSPAPQSGSHAPQHNQMQSHLKRRCCCGVLSLCNLSSGTKLTDTVTMDSMSVPDEIHQVMEEITVHQTSAGAGVGSTRLMDFGLVKIKAIEIAGDIAGNVLQIAYTVS